MSLERPPETRIAVVSVLRVDRAPAAVMGMAMARRCRSPARLRERRWPRSAGLQLSGFAHCGRDSRRTSSCCIACERSSQVAWSVLRCRIHEERHSRSRRVLVARSSGLPERSVAAGFAPRRQPRPQLLVFVQLRSQRAGGAGTRSATRAAALCACWSILSSFFGSVGSAASIDRWGLRV